jgi:hypothetical protein
VQTPVAVALMAMAAATCQPSRSIILSGPAPRPAGHARCPRHLHTDASIPQICWSDGSRRMDRPVWLASLEHAGPVHLSAQNDSDSGSA